MSEIFLSEKTQQQCSTDRNESPTKHMFGGHLHHRTMGQPYKTQKHFGTDHFANSDLHVVYLCLETSASRGIQQQNEEMNLESVMFY